MKHELNALPARLDAGGVSATTLWRFDAVSGSHPTHLHWGVVLKGSIHVDYADGRKERVQAGDVYYWPPGHTVRVDEDYEAVEFSPDREMGDVIEHLRGKMGA